MINLRFILAAFCVALALQTKTGLAEIISILPIANANDSLLTSLPTGDVTLGGVTFNLPVTRDLWIGNIGNNPPDLSATLNITPNRFDVAHLLILTGNTLVSEMKVGDQIGTLEFNYASGSPTFVPLNVGVNVREWAIGAPTPLISTFTDPNVQQVWQGTDVRGYTSVVDKLAVTLDRSRLLTSLTIRDESTLRIGKTNPILALRGVALESIPEPNSLVLVLFAIVANARRRSQLTL